MKRLSQMIKAVEHSSLHNQIINRFDNVDFHMLQINSLAFEIVQL